MIFPVCSKALIPSKTYHVCVSFESFLLSLFFKFVPFFQIGHSVKKWFPVCVLFWLLSTLVFNNFPNLCNSTVLLFALHVLHVIEPTSILISANCVPDTLLHFSPFNLHFTSFARFVHTCVPYLLAPLPSRCPTCRVCILSFSCLQLSFVTRAQACLTTKCFSNTLSLRFFSAPDKVFVRLALGLSSVQAMPYSQVVRENCEW